MVESGYSYGEVWTVPRLLRIERDGSASEVARGARNGPWTGVAAANGSFYVAEGDQLEGGRILRIQPNGTMSTLVSVLPSRGDHHTNGPAVGPDGKIYFGQGTATNSGVVGEDNAKFGWLKRYPKFHDVPCKDITLSGRNFESGKPLATDGATVTTGAYSPFGSATRPGQIVPGELPCNGVVMRVGRWRRRHRAGRRSGWTRRWTTRWTAATSRSSASSTPAFACGWPCAWRRCPDSSYHQDALSAMPAVASPRKRHVDTPHRGRCP